MYEFAYTQKFLRDVKKIKKKHFDLSRLDQVLDDLADYNSALLKRKYRNHQLKGTLVQIRGATCRRRLAPGIQAR